jgi:itaconate CoA-transferase
MLPLHGITVVTVEQAVAAPFASRQLADLGARVIKVERPGSGDFARDYDAVVNGLSAHFVWLNRSKESVTLDLKQPEAAEALRRLIARADVFIHNLAPGAMARLGFDSPALRQAYPKLVICEISGYGTSGPYRDKKAYDLLVQSETGLVSLTGTPEAPARVGLSVADISAGMYALSGILAALLRRERSGEGATLDISLFDSLAEWMGFPALYTDYSGTAPARTGARHSTIAPYGPFTAGDGKTVYLAIQSQREWRRFCDEVIERPELIDAPRFATNPLRVEHRSALETIITASFARFTSEELVNRLDAAGVASARMNSVGEFLSHPQLQTRDRWREVESPAGPLRALLPPFNLEGEVVPMGPVPALGEHSEAVLAEVGFDAATLAEWRNKEII